MSKKIKPKRKPFIMLDGTKVYPIFTDNPDIEPGLLTAEQLMMSSQHISDEELNRMVYQQTKGIVEMGDCGRVAVGWLRDCDVVSFRRLTPYAQ